MNLAQQYIEDVLSGEKQVCKYVKLAVERHIRDLEGIDGYYFDEDAGQRAIDFTKILRHTEGKWANEHFNLQPWQAFVRWVLYGWRREANDLARFNKAYLEMGRKNGKTQDASTHMCYKYEVETDNGAQILAAATKTEQASFVFNMARSMLKKLANDSDVVKDHLGAHKYQVFRHDNGSFMKAVSSEAHKLDGFNPYMAVIDEYHAHPNSNVVDVLESGMGAREDPLLLIITTAGYNIDGACYQFRKNVIDILEGKYDHPNTFGIIYTLDEGDDWRDESVWGKANPNLGITIKKEWMREQCEAAVNEGGQKEVSFKTKNLNIWTRSSETWIQTEVWNECNFDEPIEDNEPCWIGMDLSTTEDLSAVAQLWPPSGHSDKYRFKVNIYCPEDSAHHKQEKEGYPYLDWAKAGFITLTPGNVIDMEKIQHDIEQMCEKYNVQRVAFDQYQANQMSGNLANQGINMDKFAQNYPTMTEPTKKFEILVRKGEIDHYGNPVLKWMIGNTLLKRNYSGLMMPTKEKSQFKIDGIVASIMALGAYMTDEQDQESVYEGRKGFMGI